MAKKKVKVIILRPWSEDQESGQLVEVLETSVKKLAAHVRLATKAECEKGKVIKNADGGLKDQISSLEAACNNKDKTILELQADIEKLNQGEAVVELTKQLEESEAALATAKEEIEALLAK